MIPGILLMQFQDFCMEKLPVLRFLHFESEYMFAFLLHA